LGKKDGKLFELNFQSPSPVLQGEDYVTYNRKIRMDFLLGKTSNAGFEHLPLQADNDRKAILNKKVLLDFLLKTLHFTFDAFPTQKPSQLTLGLVFQVILTS
jgi:hypothetical protein